MSLSWSMIRILADNDYFYFIERAEIESIEYEVSRWIDCAVVIFIANKVGKLNKVIFVKFVFQMLFPSRFYFYVHKCLNQFNTAGCTFLAHLVGPDTCLNLADMCFPKIEHTES